jgi:hypothetical protein
MTSSPRVIILYFLYFHILPIFHLQGAFRAVSIALKCTDSLDHIDPYYVILSMESLHKKG